MRRTSSTVDWIAEQLSSCSSLCLIVLPCALATTVITANPVVLLQLIVFVSLSLLYFLFVRLVLTAKRF